MMEDEMREFLRQMQQRKKAPRPQRARPPVEGQIVEAQVVRPGSPPPQELAQRHLTPSAKPSEDLGDRPAEADDLMELHLHEHFDHQLGALAGQDTQLATEYEEPEEQGEGKKQRPPSPAQRIARLLANPQSVRDAVILNEILQPPESRW